MGYLIAIKTAVLLFPMIAFFFTIPFILYQYHKYGAIPFLRVIIVYSFILYMMTIYFLVILPLPKLDTVTPFSFASVRLIPFTFVGDFLSESSLILTELHTYLPSLREPCFYVVVFNIFMMIPFGMYLQYYFQISLRKTLLFSFFISLFFELTQLSGLYFIYPGPYRTFDVDDLLLNTLGGALGYLLMRKFGKGIPSRRKIDQEAYFRGQEVSSLRRITVFFLDLFFFVVLFLLLHLLISRKFTFYLLFLLYYVVIPYYFDGATFGSRFLNVRLYFQRNKFLSRLLYHSFLYCYYFLLPILVFRLMLLSKELFKFSTTGNLILFLGTSLFIILFYLINIFHLLFHKTIYYDSIFQVQYQSSTNPIRND